MTLETFITEDDVKRYLRSDNTFNLEVLLPHMKDAAEKYLYPYISQAFFQEIVTGVVTDTIVIAYTREALINFAGELYYDVGPMNNGASGPYENTPPEQKPVRLEVLSNAQSSRAEAGHRKINLLLEYLENNKDDFQTWVSSDAFTILHEFPIKSVTEFHKFCSIRNSRSIFLALRPAMWQAMELHLNTVIETAEALTLTPTEEKTFNTLIKNALANYAYSIGIWDLVQTFGFDSVVTVSNLTANRQKGVAALTKDLILEIEQRKASLASDALLKATKFVIERIPTPIDESTPYTNDINSSVFNF